MNANKKPGASGGAVGEPRDSIDIGKGKKKKKEGCC